MIQASEDAIQKARGDLWSEGGHAALGPRRRSWPKYVIGALVLCAPFVWFRYGSTKDKPVPVSKSPDVVAPAVPASPASMPSLSGALRPSRSEPPRVPDVVVVGIAVQAAVLSISGRDYFLDVGSSVADVRLVAVGLRSVVIESGGKTMGLDLPLASSRSSGSDRGNGSSGGSPFGFTGR